MFRAFSENRMVFVTGEPVPAEAAPTEEVAVEAVPATPEGSTPEQQFEEGKTKFDTAVAGAKSLVADLRAIYTDTTKNDDLTKLLGELDTQLGALTAEFATKEGELTTKTQED